MRILFTSLCILLYVSNTYAAIYQSRDENGNVVFTDRPEAGSVEKTISSPSTFSIKKHAGDMPHRRPDSGFGEIRIVKPKALPYTQFSIISPGNDQAIRSNVGSIALKLQLTPRLQTRFGHKIKVEFDGKMRPNSWQTSSILFTNVDRGTHTFRAYIVDKSGKRMKSSNLVSFHLLRFSRLFK